ncbi:MAG: nucleotidyltransferase domain-containing protein, partial [Luminiphilus sp.]|nr:nucleotidyltransferase domain-containing protein [Luminiphilus sp.]
MNPTALTQLVSDLRNELNETARETSARFDPSSSVTELLCNRCDAVDEALISLWRFCELDEAQASLIAVGGYGRGALFPNSDVDVLILLNDKDTAKDSLISAFVSSLWDLGLTIGHSVRTISDCIEMATADVTVMTTLLETRLLAGDPQLKDALHNEIDACDIWPSTRFFNAKIEEQTARYEKFGLTGYSLEPNV